MERRVVDPVTQIEWIVPPFATEEDTLARARADREGRLADLRLYPDHGAEYPLWAVDGPIDDPGAIGVPEALHGPLLRWQELWAAGCDVFEGWRSAEAEKRWLALGRELHTELEAALWLTTRVLACF
ncbi:hypothetical protein [Rathayibacter sp. AY1E1]|uniref:hypothetical protein n=1 Tax=Rathayibacter sp. AY1E1 TaxID=2080549 RepID=UPI0015E3EE06|nr:hypothetical protein [Rathayibacter sp. AY1E1]